MSLCKAEFIISYVKGIIWNPSSLDNFAIPFAKKRMIIALAEAHVSRAFDDVFDDFVFLGILAGPKRKMRLVRFEETLNPNHNRKVLAETRI